MRTRSKLVANGLGVGLLASFLALAAPIAAHAEDPVDLAGAYVLDTVGATTGDELRIQGALDSLYDRANIQLFAVFVDRFTNPFDAIDWADTVAIDNNLGTNDLLLAVATGDRQYALSIASDFPMSSAQLDRVENAIEAELRDNDWSGAVIAGAQALEAEATGVVGPNAPPEQPTTPTTPTTSSGGFPWGWVVLGGAAAVGGGAFIVSRIRKRNADGSVSAKPEGMTQQELDRRAGTLLVQLDDALKTSEQELGFAVAQFGETATADFAAVLASAKQKVQQAFQLQQQLDDAQPETPEQKRAMTIQIIQLCESADAELDAQADAFDELRQLEKNAPQELAEARADAAKARERRAEVTTTLAKLEAAYADSAIKPVADNLEQADKLLTYADEAAKKADADLAAGNTSEAAIAVRTAQASVGQVRQLFDAIDELAAGLADATSKLEAAVADTRSDIAAARALPQDDKSAALVPAIAAAEQALDEAAKLKGDPLAAVALVDAANTSLDQVFASVRDEQQKVAQARTKLDATISAARAGIQSASEFITTRRGGIGNTARTRVAEADRRLTQALSLSASDPVAALAEAQAALQLANTAMSLARNDVAAYRKQIVYDEDELVRGGDGADLGGLFDVLFGGGGGSSGGSWSSSSSRRSGSSGSVFSGGSSRSSRSSRSGGFGGSSRSSRSSSRSGGGRSRGGRF